MTKSALQIARASYEPKMPAGLKGNVIMKEGAATVSVADREEISALSLSLTGCQSLRFPAHRVIQVMTNL